MTLTLPPAPMRAVMRWRACWLGESLVRWHPEGLQAPAHDGATAALSRTALAAGDAGAPHAGGSRTRAWPLLVVQPVQ